MYIYIYKELLKKRSDGVLVRSSALSTDHGDERSIKYLCVYEYVYCFLKYFTSSYSFPSRLSLFLSLSSSLSLLPQFIFFSLFFFLNCRLVPESVLLN